MQNSAGIVADGDQDRDQPRLCKDHAPDFMRIIAGDLDRDGDKASREHWTRIFYRFFSSEILQHKKGRRPSSRSRQPERINRHRRPRRNTGRKSLLLSETGTERHQETAESVKRLIQP